MQALLHRASIFVGSTALFLMFPQILFAAGNIYFVPGAQTLTQGQTFDVAVRFSTDEVVNAAQITINYPSQNIEFLTSSASNSAFPIGIQTQASGNTISITRGILGDGISGDNPAIIMSFKVKPEASGPVLLSLLPDSALVRGIDQVNILTGSPSASYTIQAPQAPTSARATPTPTSRTVQITDIAVSDITYTSANIHWKTDQATSSFVEYGLTTAYNFSAADSMPTKVHQLTLHDPVLLPGVTYHYRIRSGEGAKQSLSADRTFSTPGIVIAIEVRDESGDILANTPVTLTTQQKTFSSVTSSEGIASFENVPPTKALLKATPPGREPFTTEISIAPPKQAIADKPQQFTVRVAGVNKKTQTNDRLFLVGFIFILAGIAGGYAFWKWKKSQKISPSSPVASAPTDNMSRIKKLLAFLKKAAYTEER